MKTSEKGKYVLIGGAGLIVVGFFVARSLTANNSNYKNIQGEKFNPQSGGGGTAPNYTPQQTYTPQMQYGYGLTTSEAIEIQNYLQKYGYNIGSSGADGVISTNMLNAIRQDMEYYGSKVNLKNNLQNGNLKPYLVAVRGFEGSVSSSSSNSSVSSSVNFDAMDRNQLNTYIKSKTARLVTDLGAWYQYGLVEWAKALSQGKGTFICSQCWTKGMYDAQTGAYLGLA